MVWSPMAKAIAKANKGILLFEVAFVVLLVSVISMFIFRAYGVFAKTGKKSSDYLRLILLSEEKVWDLELEENNKEAKEGMQTQGRFDDSFSWQVNLEDTNYDNLKKAILTVSSDKRKYSLDTFIYLSFPGQ